jgi:hypothetical protein
MRITVTATALTMPPVANAAAQVNAKSRKNCLAVTFMEAFHQPILLPSRKKRWPSGDQLWRTAGSAFPGP